MNASVYAATVRIVQKCQNIAWEDDPLEQSSCLTAEVTLDDCLRSDLTVLIEASTLTDLKRNGQRLSLATESLQEQGGDSVQITFCLPPPNSERAIVKNFTSLLQYNSFLYEPPKQYYSIEDMSDEPPLAYLDTVKFGTFLCRIADHCEESLHGKKIYFYEGIKVGISMTFAAENVCCLPELETLIEDFRAPHLEERTKIFKAAVLKTVLSAPSAIQTFTHLVKKFDRIKQTFDNDWALYLSDFSMEKTLEALEGKTLKLADKIAVSLSDLQKTMITIPLAILFAAPRMDPNEAHTLLNILTILSVWLFALFTWAFFSSHKRSLNFILAEIEEQKLSITTKHPDLAEKLSPKFTRLEKRCNDQVMYRRVVGSLMWMAALGITAIFYWPESLFLSIYQ